jgi:hypothetical protein
LLNLHLDNLREFSAPGRDRMHDLDAVHLATSLNEPCLAEPGDIGLDA